MKVYRLDTERDLAAAFAQKAPPGWAAMFGPYAELRSHEQNAAYWVWIGEVCDAGVQDSDGNPFTADRLHSVLKRRFLGKFIRIMPNGDTEELEASTTRLKRREFADYMTKCQAWIAETA